MSVAQKLLSVEASSKWSLRRASFDNVSSGTRLASRNDRQLAFNASGTNSYEANPGAILSISYSSAWNVATASSVTSISLENTSGLTQGIGGCCLADGRLFASIQLGGVSERVGEYDFNGDLIALSSDINIVGPLFINEAGTYLYIASGTSVSVYEMSSAFDLSTLSLDYTVNLSSTLSANIVDIKVKPDGKRFFIQSYLDECYEFRTTVAWDLQNAFYTGFSYSIAATGFDIKPDGSKLFASAEVSANTRRIEQHSLG